MIGSAELLSNTVSLGCPFCCEYFGIVAMFCYILTGKLLVQQKFVPPTGLHTVNKFCLLTFPHFIFFTVKPSRNASIMPHPCLKVCLEWEHWVGHWKFLLLM